MADDVVARYDALIATRESHADEVARGLQRLDKRIAAMKERRDLLEPSCCTLTCWIGTALGFHLFLVFAAGVFGNASCVRCVTVLLYALLVVWCIAIISGCIYASVRRRLQRAAAVSLEALDAEPIGCCCCGSTCCEDLRDWLLGRIFPQNNHDVHVTSVTKSE